MLLFFKWIGGGVGWYFGGPLGSVLGFIAGTVIDSFEIRIFRKQVEQTAMGDFATALLTLIAATMKAEGPVVKPELDYVKHFLRQNISEKETTAALALLKELLQKDAPLDDACTKIRNHIDYSSRLQLTHFLYNLANIDAHVSDAEQTILNIIASGLRVSVSEKRTVGALMPQEESIIAAYEVLGIHRTASTIDVKKAYRNMAIKYHPDKVAYLGEELRKVANDKFQQLTRAYDVIKRERNFT